MKIKYIILILILIILESCKTNQYLNDKKHGKWITYDSINNEKYKYIDKYFHGKEVKTWKIKKNNKLFYSETYKDTITEIKYYNEKRKIISKGQSKIENSEKELHWFYQGDWLFYDDNGKLIEIKKYNKGELISQTKIK